MFTKHFFNALMYDICNWGFNIAMVAFLWSTNHWYCVAICGLFVMRFIADFMFRRSMYAEQLEARTKLLKQLDQQQKITSSPLTDEEKLSLEELLEHDDFDQSGDIDFLPETKKDDDKKVH